MPAALQIDSVAQHAKVAGILSRYEAIGATSRNWNKSKAERLAADWGLTLHELAAVCNLKPSSFLSMLAMRRISGPLALLLTHLQRTADEIKRGKIHDEPLFLF